MKLLLFALLSISNGYYESNGLHDVGTMDGVHDAGITLERRSGGYGHVYLKPWVLQLLNSRARDDRIGSQITPTKLRTVGYGPIIPVESLCKAQENYMHL